MLENFKEYCLNRLNHDNNVIYTLEFIRNVTCQLIKLIIQKSSIPLITDITFSQINSISVSALIIENILYILAAP